MRLRIIRDTFTETATLGTLYSGPFVWGFTCEDTDRKLEAGGVKIPAHTAIPRGTYEVVVSMSNRFKKRMVEIKNVPGFSGIRIHGGNTHDDTEGCPLLGAIRTSDGVRDCKTINARLIEELDASAARGEISTIEVS